MGGSCGGERIAGIVAVRHRRFGRPTLLHDGTSTLWGVDDIVVKTTPAERPLIGRARRGHAVATWLHARGMATTKPLGWHEVGGYGAGVFERVTHEHDFSPESVAPLLAGFHERMRAYPARRRLPMLSVDAWYGPLRDTACSHGLDGADLRLVDAAREACPPLIGPIRPIHADLHRANVLATGRGPLLVDFDLVGLGPADWDWSGVRWRMPASHWERACALAGIDGEAVAAHEPTHWLLAVLWQLTRHDEPRRALGRCWLRAGCRHALDLPREAH